jgi:hypothetical protein
MQHAKARNAVIDTQIAAASPAQLSWVPQLQAARRGPQPQGFDGKREFSALAYLGCPTTPSVFIVFFERE